jgi:Tol biopolymer transport system component
MKQIQGGLLMEKKALLVSGCMLMAVILVACGPSQAELDAQATQVAANIFATLTAEAPTPTPTPASTLTPTPTPTPFLVPTPSPTTTSTPIPPSTQPALVVTDFTPVPGLTGAILLVVRPSKDSGYLLYMVNTTTGEGKVILSEKQLSGWMDPVSLSPDSDKLAFFDDAQHLAVLHTDTGQVERWVNAMQAAGERYLAWSPGGDRLAFVNNRDLWVVNEDGSNLTRLVKHQWGYYGILAVGRGNLEHDQVRRVVWMPDGKKILYDDFPKPQKTYSSEYVLPENKAIYAVDIESLVNTKIVDGYQVVGGSCDGVIAILEYVGAYTDKPNNPTLKLMGQDGDVAEDFGILAAEYPSTTISSGCRYLAFGERRDHLTVLSLDSRKRITVNFSISTWFNPDLSAWAPDGNQLGLWQDSSFQAIDPATGETDQVFRLTEDANVARVYWFSRDIHPAEPSPSEPPSPPLPTGRILFASSRAKAVDASYCDLDFDIFVQNLDRSNLRNLTPNTYWDGWPTISPNGERIAFLAMRRDTDDDGEVSCQDVRELWVMNSDGSDQFRISGNDIQIEAPPRWSPDGRQIAFVALEPDLNESRRALYVINADGSGQQLLADNLEYWPEYDLIKPFDWFQYSWDPDSLRIAFGGDEITIVSADGRSKNRLTSTCEQPVSDPAWSPDGDQIAFVCAGDERDEIRVMNSDGAEERTLLPGLAGAFDSRIANLQWSPDGSQIAFVSEVGLTVAHWRIVEGAGSYFSLHLINSDGSNPRQLVRNIDRRFSWTPDGEWLLSGFRYGDIFLVHAIGTGLTQLTDDSGDREIANEQPDWLP